MTIHLLEAHGLRIASDLDLDALAASPAEGPADADLRIVQVDPGPTQGGVEMRPADVEPILSYDYDNGESVEAWREIDGSTALNISGVAHFRASNDYGLLEVTCLDPAQAELTRILTQGWAMATLLMLRGQVVFHATAVLADGRTLMFLADSGQGKSTTTAMLLRDGAELISDDVLRVDFIDGRPAAYAGINALRLRPKAHGLVPGLVERGGTAVDTADDRIAVSFEPPSPGPLPIDAVFIPAPVEGIDRPEVRWLEPKIATYELNNYPRVFDWHITDPTRRHFELSTDIAMSTPVGWLDVPWGPPWPSGLLSEVLATLDR